MDATNPLNDHHGNATARGSTRPPRLIGGWARWRRALVGALAIGIVAMAVTAPADATASTITQCDGVDNQGGRTVHCTVEVDMATDTVTVTSCTGFANAAETCIGPTVSTLSVTDIDQCNGSGNGGGAVVTCDVIVTGASGADAVTISQCVGSGEGGGTEPTTVCIPGSTPDDTSATIQQCDSSGNGGGATERVQCSVAPASTSASVPTIKQCNGSGNGGGALVTCTVTISASGSGTATATGSVTPGTGTATTTPPVGAATSTPIAAGTTATPASGVILAPDTGSGPGSGGSASEWVLALILATLGLAALGTSATLRR